MNIYELVLTLDNQRGSGVNSEQNEITMACCCLVTQSRLTLCDSMDCSTPGLPVPHHLPKFAQVHVHCISDAIQPSHPLMPSSPSSLSLSQHWGLSNDIPGTMIGPPELWATL